MKLRDFLKDKCLILILHFACMCLLSGFLHATDYYETNIMLIQLFWVFIIVAWLSVTYWQRKNYFWEAEQILEKIDQRYLLGELLPNSFRLEDRMYKKMIQVSNKSVIECIRQMKDDQKDYKEYIESWVHEVKAPITGISLICENRRKAENQCFVILAVICLRLSAVDADFGK